MKNKLLLLLLALSFGAWLVYGLYKAHPSPTLSIEQQFMGALSIGGEEDPLARFTWEHQRLADPTTGQIPADMRFQELAFARRLRQQSSSRDLTSLDSLTWLHRGPFNMGGRTRAFAADITNPNLLLAAGVSGGMWRLTDGGQTWKKVSAPDDHQGITCLVQDTRAGHTNTWYYGTGEGYGNSAGGNGSYYLGDGIYKSTDLGLTWETVGTTGSGAPQIFTSNFQIIWQLATDPSNAAEDELYAATYGKIYRSSNGGQTWTAELGNSPSSSYATQVVVTSTGVVYATLTRDADAPGGVYRSTDGLEWTEIAPPTFPSKYDRIVMGLNPSNENEVYFLASLPDTTVNEGKQTYNFQNEAERNALWKYTYLSGDGSDAGGMWEDRSANLPLGPYQFDDFIAQGGYDLLVTVKPNDPNVVFIGGTNIYRSTDAFTTPNNTRMVGGYKEDTALPLFELYTTHHPDQHVLFFHPQNPNVLFSGNDGGIYRSDDAMAETIAWQSLNSGYLTTQFYTIAFNHSVSDNVLIGGLQDNGTRFVNKADTTKPWTMPFNYDGSYCAVPNDRDYYLMSVQQGPIVKVQVDENGQMTNYQRIDPVGGDDYLFINPFIMDPVYNDVIYLAEGRNLWINSSVWAISIQNTYEKTNINWDKHTDEIDDVTAVISALAASTQPASRLYIGTSEKSVYRIDNTFDVFTPFVDITDLQFPAGGYVTNIAVDPRDADKVFVVFSNYSVYSLFYSEDAGETWTKVAGNLEANSAGSGAGPSLRSISVLPIGADSTSYFLGTSIGLYHTSTIDGLNTEWTWVSPDKIGTTVVEMVQTRELDKMVVAATHGNGVFSANTPVDIGVGIPNSPTVGSMASVWPSPASNIAHIQLPLTQAATVDLQLFDVSGKQVRRVQQQVDKGKTITLNVADLPGGVYVYSATASGKRYTGKLVVQ